MPSKRTTSTGGRGGITGSSGSQSAHHVRNMYTWGYRFRCCTPHFLVQNCRHTIYRNFFNDFDHYTLGHHGRKTPDLYDLSYSFTVRATSGMQLCSLLDCIRSEPVEPPLDWGDGLHGETSAWQG